MAAKISMQGLQQTPQRPASHTTGSHTWAKVVAAWEHRTQFDRKMPTGTLFRVEMPARLKGLGFEASPPASRSLNVLKF
jgi:hypothetical protein